MFTWTNQPYESMWNHLRLLQASKNVEALLTGKMRSKRAFILEDEELTKRKSQQIAYAIKQADEYFAAAETVSIATSPLLYFYGMLSLAKAATVANNKEMLLDDIKYHGLFTRSITEELKQYNDNYEHWRIENEFAVANDGVACEFFKVAHLESLPKNSIIRFKDILKINPEIGELYSRYYNEPACFFPLYSYKTTEQPFSIEINPQTTNKHDFLKSFDSITNDFDISDEILHSQALILRSKPHVTAVPKYMGIYYPIPGGRYLVSGLEYEENSQHIKKYIPPELCDYIGMFILGDIVRYKQEFWGGIITGEIDGSISLVNLFVSIAENRFPNYILNLIFNEKFEYGSPGRLM
jgi:hypothetical protein